MPPKPPTLPEEDPLLAPAWWHANRELGRELRRILAQTDGFCRAHGCEMLAQSNGWCSEHQTNAPSSDWWIPQDDNDSGPDS